MHFHSESGFLWFPFGRLPRHYVPHNDIAVQYVIQSKCVNTTKESRGSETAIMETLPFREIVTPSFHQKIGDYKTSCAACRSCKKIRHLYVREGVGFYS